MWARLASVALGVWLMAAPAALDTAHAASTSERVVGPIVVGVSCAALSPSLRSLRWLALPAAAWLILAPWALGGDSAATIDSVAVGLVLAALAFARGSEGTRCCGWRAVAPLLRTPRRQQASSARHG